MTRDTKTLTPLDIAAVTFRKGFWAQRRETNRTISLLDQYAKCKKTGRIDWFLPQKKYRGHLFWDSDVAKWVEASCYSLITHPDKALRRLVDLVVDRIVAAQSPDGYMNVHFTKVEPKQRWADTQKLHELYTAGHLMEAAVAHWRATGRRNFLDAVCRFADYIATVFGRGKGQKRGYPGHEEIELALMKLYHATGQRRYLRLSKYFVDERGRRPYYWDAEAKALGRNVAQARSMYNSTNYDNFQAHLPVRRQTEIRGHAVRAMYLCAGMADVARETRDTGLFSACRRLWDNATRRKMYLTGGVGSERSAESFGHEYHLPNDTAYAETCAAIGLAFFAHRMLQIDPRGEYADAMELALYNGALSGVGLDGKSYFYVNPLSSDGKHRRSEWFGCACCPSNLGRLLASLGQYVYSTGAGKLWVHLYTDGTATARLGEQEVSLRVRTDYPWDGRVRLTVQSKKPASFALALHVPGWCETYSVRVNGRKTSSRAVNGYLTLRRRWRNGDTVELTLDMPIRRIVAHPRVTADAGKVALQRGPIVYCLEECDHGRDVRTFVLNDKAPLKARFNPRLLGGATVLEGTALSPEPTGWDRNLYRPAATTRLRRVKIRAIPYAFWANRTAGTMTVWLTRGL